LNRKLSLHTEVLKCKLSLHTEVLNRNLSLHTEVLNSKLSLYTEVLNINGGGGRGTANPGVQVSEGYFYFS
jgi:hypothetical protein